MISIGLRCGAAAAIRPSAGAPSRVLGANGRAPGRSFSVLRADEGALGVRVHHLLNMGLLVAAPVAMVLSPSMLNTPVDLTLGVAMPLHAHIGMNYVISDYVPKQLRGPARAALVAATAVAILGLTRLNVAGPGITESTKALWRKAAPKAEPAAAPLAASAAVE